MKLREMKENPTCLRILKSPEGSNWSLNMLPDGMITMKTSLINDFVSITAPLALLSIPEGLLRSNVDLVELPPPDIEGAYTAAYMEVSIERLPSDTSIALVLQHGSVTICYSSAEMLSLASREAAEYFLFGLDSQVGIGFLPSSGVYFVINDNRVAVLAQKKQSSLSWLDAVLTLQTRGKGSVGETVLRLIRPLRHLVPYLKLQLGEATIQQMSTEHLLARLARQLEEPQVNALELSPFKAEDLAGLSLKKLNELEAELLHWRQVIHEALRRGNCVVCLERGPNVVLTPCKHLSVCHECSQKVSQCPLCKSNIEAKILVANL